MVLYLIIFLRYKQQKEDDAFAHVGGKTGV